MRALRMLMMADGTVLVILGALFILLPRHVEVAFHFDNLAGRVWTISLAFGAAHLRTLGFGYGIVAMDPRRHIVWVQIGIARGLLEVAFGGFCIARGVIHFQQGSFGMIVAASSPSRIWCSIRERSGLMGAVSDSF
jgi:hypothetical protein